MRKLIAKDLKIKFVETLNELDDFSYEDGNPFFIKIGSKQYFVFLKNMSPAYFKNSPDVSRVQLPYSDHFSRVLEADITFIIFGYDLKTDTVVTWNPIKIKERLNAKRNVSLYSRYSLQNQVNGNEFKIGFLSNGEKIILFKRDNLLLFFDALDNLFIDNNLLPKCLPKITVGEPATDYSVDRLLEINDSMLLSIIDPLLRKNQVLQAVEITSKYYSGKYQSMTFKDWYKLVNEKYRKMIG